MAETGEGSQPTIQESAEAQKPTLRDKTREFWNKHKFATSAALGQMVTTQVYLGSKSLQDVVVNGLIGIGSGLLIGGLIDHQENKWKRESEARQERYREARISRRKLSAPKSK